MRSSIIQQLVFGLFMFIGAVVIVAVVVTVLETRAYDTEAEDYKPPALGRPI